MISIIVPVYNGKGFLTTCLSSVRTQNVLDWECIIVDDASTDGSGDEAHRITKGDKRFHIVRLDKNVGMAEARNVGMAHAKGEFYFFLDVDDYLDSHALEHLLVAHWQYPDAGRIVAAKRIHCYSCDFEKDLTVTPPGYHSALSPHLFSDRTCDIGYSTGCLYVPDKIPCKMEFPHVPQHEDMLFNMELLFAGTSCYIIPHVIYHYVRRNDSLVSQPMTIGQANLLRQQLRTLVDKYHPATDIRDKCYRFLENALQGRLGEKYKDNFLNDKLI